MVIDQGSLLDRIDYNVERTAEHVKAADKELNVATGYQKKSTKRKIMLLLILLIVGMFILVLIKPRKKAEPVTRVFARDLPESIKMDSNGGIDSRRAKWKQRRRRHLSLGESMMPL